MVDNGNRISLSSYKNGLKLIYGDSKEYSISYTYYFEHTIDSSIKTVSILNGKGRYYDYYFSQLGCLEKTVEHGGVDASGNNLPDEISTHTYINGTCSHTYADTVTVTDPYGIRTLTSTNARGLKTQVIVAEGTSDERYVNTTWHPIWNKPLKIETNDKITQFEYLSDSRPLVVKKEITDKQTGDVKVWNYQYSFYSNGVLQSSTTDGPRNDVSDITKLNYDSSGRLISMVDALGYVTHYSNYNTNGYLQKISNPNQTSETLQYNALNLIENRSISSNEGTSKTSYKYNYHDDIVTTVSPTGLWLGKLYNQAGLVTRKYISDIYGDHVERYTYDAAGNLSSVKRGYVPSSYRGDIGESRCDGRDIDEGRCSPDDVTEEDDVFNTTFLNQSTYDAAGRLSFTLDSKNHKTTHKYDLLGRITSTVDANGVEVEKSSYDDFGNVKLFIDGVGRQTHYEYDNLNDITKLTDNLGRVFTFDYDGFGQLVSEDTPATGHKSYRHDEAGNLTLLTLNDGNTVSYSYDALNRTESRTLSTGESVTYDYDIEPSGVGKLGRLTFNDGQYQFHYGNVLRVVSSVDYSIGRDNYSVAYSYDLDGKVTSLTYPSGYTVTYGYDSVNGLVNKVSDSKGQTLLSGVTFLPFGPIKSYKPLGNGTVTYTADNDYRTTKITGTGFGLTYTYDNVGRVSSKTDSSNTAQNFQYTYYNNSELKTEKRNASSGTAYSQLSYFYDGIGNRNKLSTYTKANNTTSNQTLSYTNGILTNYAGSGITYDGRGNIIRDTVHGALTTRTFNALNQLTQACFNGSCTTYEYDPFGHRIYKSGRYGTYHFIYDESGRLLAESLNGTITKEYIYLGNLLVSIRANNTHYFVKSDNQGRPEVVTNSSGSVVWKANNDAFSRTVSTNSIGDMNIGFPGQYYDKETDTWYNNARDYDAKLGRYLQSDPLGTIDGPNTYLYAGNNPVNNVDPSGKIIDTVFDVGFIAYDVYQIATGGFTPVNMAALGADFAGLATPFGTGFGMGVRTAHAAEEAAVHAASTASHAADAAKTAVVEAKVTKGAGKSRNKPPAPLKEAEGRPHSIIEKLGKDGQYTTHNGDGTWKQYRGSGQDHGGIPRPNVKEAVEIVTPDGRTFIDKGRVRPPQSNEIPGGN